MYLKSIKVYGFKSFADKLEINFCKNINGIVGPNGSGKSNVVDAVRWVLGEQSIKSLRGEAATDIIFSGSKSRKALNSASVTLVFDNSDLYLPVNYTEVSVKRVMYRSGDNEYYLNNEKCRLKDISTLLMDSGADKESFNIIGQGRIDEILSTKPLDRRAVFESAAGVLKYKKRKEEAIKKIERVNNNMARVNDIILELENNLTPLERQKVDATSFLELKDDLSNLEISLMVRDIENLNHETKSLKDKIDTLNDELIEISNNHSSYDIEIISKKDDLKKLENEISQQQNTFIEITKSIEKIDADIRVLKTRRELQGEFDESKFLILKEDILKSETSINEFKNKIEEQEQSLRLAHSNYSNEEKRLHECSIEKKKISNSLENIGRQKTDLKYEIDVLESNLENDSSIPNSVKSILNNKRLKGAHDVLGKLISIPSMYSTAISISLGGAVNYLVVDTVSDVKDMVYYLKDNKLGRATFLPIDSIKSRYVDEVSLSKLSHVEGFLTVASDVVDCDDLFSNIVKSQLGNVIIARDLDCANKIGKLINSRYKIVTLDGQVVNAGGSITGGSTNSGHNYLKDKYELVSKQQELKTLEDKEADVKKKLQDSEEESLELDKRIGVINREILSITETKNHILKNLENEQLRLRSLKQELEDVEALGQNESDKRLDSMLTLYYSAIANRDNIQKEKDVLLSKKEDLERSILEIEELQKREMYYTNSKEKSLKELEIKLNTSNIRLDNLLISLGEEYNITFDKAKDSYFLDIDEEVAREKIKDLKDEIKKLGYVNVDAINEYEKVKTRYDFLMKQKDDLKDAEDVLFKIVQEMDSVLKERFLSTFEAIRVEFKKVFKEMFGGGEAELVLTNPNNLLETGIEIEAVPSGKVLKSISLLSGGEKTFTAISLLFAILNVRQVPFCLFDEVEAALDDANVESFGNYLYKYRDKTQFILITHKKKTMEFADVLYGITMQESGVSRLVSVKLDDLEEDLQ